MTTHLWPGALPFIFDGGNVSVVYTGMSKGVSLIDKLTRSVNIETASLFTKHFRKTNLIRVDGTNPPTTESTLLSTGWEHKTGTTIHPISVTYFGSTDKQYYKIKTASLSTTVDAVLCGYKLETYQWTFKGDAGDSSTEFTPPRWPTATVTVKWSSEGKATKKAAAIYSYQGNAKPFYGAGEQFHLRLTLCGDKKLIPVIGPPEFPYEEPWPRHLNQPIAYATSSNVFIPQFIKSWSEQKPTVTLVSRKNTYSSSGRTIKGEGTYATFDGGQCSEFYETFTQKSTQYFNFFSVDEGITLNQPCFTGVCGGDPSLAVYFCGLFGYGPPPSTKAICSGVTTSSIPPGVTSCIDNSGKKCMCSAGFSGFTENRFNGSTNKGIVFPDDAAPILVSKVSRLNVDSFVYSEPVLSGTGKTGTTYSLSADFPSFAKIHWASINAVSFKAPFVHTWSRTYTLTEKMGEPFRHTLTYTTTKPGKTGTFSASSERTTHASWWISEAPPVTITLTSASAGTTYTFAKLLPPKKLSAFCPAYLSTTTSAVGSKKSGVSVLVTSYGDMSFEGKPKYISEDALAGPPYSVWNPLTAQLNLGPRWTTSGFEILSWTQSVSQASSGRSDRVLVDVSAEWGFKKGSLTYKTFDNSTLSVFNEQTSTNSFDAFTYRWLRDQGGLPANSTTTFFFGYTIPDNQYDPIVPKFIGNNTAHGLIKPNGYFDFPYEAYSEVQGGQYTPRPYVYYESVIFPGWQDGTPVAKSSSTYFL